jgi:hypothetical protein
MTTKTTKPKKQEIMLRLSDETVEKIDRIIAQTQSEKPGLPVTRAGVCYMLLEAAIAAWEINTKPAEAQPAGPVDFDACAVCGGSGRIANDLPCSACHRSTRSPGTTG